MSEEEKAVGGEKVEEVTGLRVLGTKVEGDSLYVELASINRDELTNKGRAFALDMVNTNHEFSGWARAGVEKVSSPVAFDPKNPDNDPYTVDTSKPETKWHYRQSLRLTRSPI